MSDGTESRSLSVTMSGAELATALAIGETSTLDFHTGLSVLITLVRRVVTTTYVTTTPDDTTVTTEQ